MDTRTRAASLAPWRASLDRLARNVPVLVSAAVLVLVVASALAAPWYAQFIAHTDPFTPNLTGTILVRGEEVPVFQTEEGAFAPVPAGPTWTETYLLGADTLGRDLMARVLYGSRTSLLIGGLSALIVCVAGALVGIIAGYFGGWIDTILSRLMDLVWAFPFYILAISLASVLLIQDIRVGDFVLDGANPIVPTLILSYVFIPYVGRPVRALVASLRQREFVQAGILSGASDAYVLRREILPNVLPLVITMVPLMMSRTVLVEASLSFLGVGVQPPNTSWGLIINEGYTLLTSRPWISMAPGIVFTLTLVALNIIGESLRDELDRSGRTRGLT